MTTNAPTTADRSTSTLTSPEEFERRHPQPGWWRQSLANGALGAALWHTERARTERAPWHVAQDWLRYAAAGPIDDGPSSNLHYGAPALAYVLHHASTTRPANYARALDVLDARITAATTARLDTAHRRIDAQRTPTMAEFDAIRGLTGLGAYWLRRNPGGAALRGILEYLVRLTTPVPRGDRALPGWWTHLAPNGRRTQDFPDGHANNGLSHGIAGPLALLALATRANVQVPGQNAAIRRILAWFDACQQTRSGQIRWPYWITTAHLNNPSEATPWPGTKPSRPSWCYGTTGITRAQHMAGLALGDHVRSRNAVNALIAVLAAPDLALRLPDVGLCHGLAGALLISRRTATDTDDTRIAEHVGTLHNLVTANQPEIPGTPDRGAGLLDGATGTALALEDAPPSGWDSCLLTS